MSRAARVMVAWLWWCLEDDVDGERDDWAVNALDSPTSPLRN